MLPILIYADMEGDLLYFERIVRKLIKEETLTKMDIALTAASPYELLEYINNHKRQSVYFLNIDLKRSREGIKLAARIREIDPCGYLIMLTPHGMQTAVFQYKVWAMGTIAKGLYTTEDDIRDCLKRINTLYLMRYDIRQCIELGAGEKTISMKEEEIYCMDVLPFRINQIRIYKRHGYMKLNSSLTGIEQRLNGSFFKCRQSCIINLNHIADIDWLNRKVVLDNGKICTVSKKRMQPLADAFYRNAGAGG